MRNHLQLFNEYEILFITALNGALAYMAAGNSWSEYGVILGYIAGTFFYRYGGTYEAMLNEAYPPTQASFQDLQHFNEAA